MSKRKNIRNLISENFLNVATKNALREEEYRQERINENIRNSNSFSDSHVNNVLSTPTLIEDDFSRSDLNNFAQQKQLTTSLVCRSSSLVPCKAPKYDPKLENGSVNSVSLAILIDENDQAYSDDDVCISHISHPKTISLESPSCIVAVNSDVSMSDVIRSNSVTQLCDYGQIQDLDDGKKAYDIDLFQSLFSHSPDCRQCNDLCFLPHLINAAKPHQKEGLIFIYENIIEDAHTFNTSSGGFGCILAHSMGLGKSFQSIAFIELFLRCTESTHVLVIAPVNTLHNWNKEFEKWLPSKHSINNYTRPFRVLNITEQEKSFKQRFDILNRWKFEGGVLIIGYELFRSLVGLSEDLQLKAKKKLKKSNPFARDVYKILCDPGPDLVICDEAQRIKNESAAITVAIKHIRTRRRIMLTGYPLQNNLLEYWCMIDFVRPNYLGSKKEFRNLFLRPIENGQCQNSIPGDVRLMLQRIHVLHHMLSGIIQRRSEMILSQSLPPKLEYVFFISLSECQSQLYDYIVNDLREERRLNSSINPLLAFAICCKIWNHPDILYNITKRSHSASDLSRSLIEDEEDEFIPRKEASKEYYNLVSDPQVIMDCFKDYEPELLENGPKFVLLFNILDLSVSMGEKVLVFSQSIPTLNLLEKFLQKSYIPNEATGTKIIDFDSLSYSTEFWRLNCNYFRLDGSSTSLERHNMVSDFNNPNLGHIRLFLISTRAGSLGINLIAASRIIILDVSWNPCHDAQAVCRAYRYGQIRECFVYRLITDGTFESKMYKRQISKISTSDRVLDQLRPERIVTKEDIFSAITSPVEHVEPIKNLHLYASEYTDIIIKDICSKTLPMLTRVPLLHESFFTDSSDDSLNEKEKKEASEIYLTERELCRQREVSSRRPDELYVKLPDDEIQQYHAALQQNEVIIQCHEPMRHSMGHIPFDIFSSKFDISHEKFVTPFRIASPISISDSDDNVDAVQINVDYDDVHLETTPIAHNNISGSFLPHFTQVNDTSQEPFILIIDSPSKEDITDT